MMFIQTVLLLREFFPRGKGSAPFWLSIHPVPVITDQSVFPINPAAIRQLDNGSQIFQILVYSCDKWVYSRVEREQVIDLCYLLSCIGFLLF